MQGQDLMIEIDCLDGQGLTIDIDSDADRASLEKEGTTNQQLANWPQYDDYTHCHQNCGVYMNRGRRSDMQDRYAFQQLPYEHVYLAVFDGHGSDKIADFLANRLHAYIAANQCFAQNAQLAIQQAFSQIDAEILKSPELKAHQCGSVALSAIVNKRTVRVANLGDSRAVIFKKNGDFVQLSVEHTTVRQDESDRISRLGGWIVPYRNSMRLMGQLNVTRAFGDAIYRPYITSEPEFSTYSFTTDDVLLVLATDGLWNELSLQEVSQIIQQRTNTDLSQLARQFYEAIREKGQVRDNFTAVCFDIQGYLQTETNGNIQQQFSTNFQQFTSIQEQSSPLPQKGNNQQHNTFNMQYEKVQTENEHSNSGSTHDLEQPMHNNTGGVSNSSPPDSKHLFKHSLTV